MNRKSLFGRLAASAAAKHTAVRPEYTNVRLEALEQRQLLTVASTFVDDNWYDFSAQDVRGDGILMQGDTVISNNGTGITKTYGVDAFGTVLGTDVPSLANKGLINDAIVNTNTGGTVNILVGTFKESDILIDRAMTVQGAATATTVIVPEIASSVGSAEFPVGSHQGIIINAVSVTVQLLTVDGSGNSAGAGTFAYHQGITNLYEPQGGGDYTPLHPSGRPATVPIANIGGEDSDTRIVITNVAVKNTYWHGITLSGISGDTIGTNSIKNSTVTNVGNTTPNQDKDRIGILLQNNDTSEVRSSTVSNVGVGVASRMFGTGTFGNSNDARNKTGMILDVVNNAQVAGYSLSNADDPIELEGFLLGSIFVGFDANQANFVGANTAIGILVNHSQPLIAGGVITGYNTGIKVQNTTLTDLVLPVVMGTLISGPGGSSVGILATNDGTETNSASFQVSGTTIISGFGTGIKSLQTVAPGDSAANIVSLERPDLISNTVGIDIGAGATAIGTVRTTTVFSATGGTVSPTTQEGFAVSQRPSTLLPPTADIMHTGATTLSSTSTYAPLLTGQSASIPLFNFNAAQAYEDIVDLPQLPQDGTIQQPYVAGNSWQGGVSQTGDGQLHISAVNGGVGFMGGLISHPIAGETFETDNTDITGATYLNLVAKIGAGNMSQGFLFGIVDRDGSLEFWPASMSALNSTGFSTIQVNLLSIGVPILNDGVFDMSNVAGYAFAGDLGLFNGQQTVPLAIDVDDMFTSSTPNSQLDVTGTVNITGSTLAGTLKAGYNPATGTQFTIINNDGSDNVTGTFAGIAQNGFTTIGGLSFKVNYSAGSSNNDVVLTRQDAPANTAPVLDLDGGTGGNNFTTTWTNGGAVNIETASASITDDGTTLASMTATITSTNAGDVLSAVATGNITVDAFAGNTLFMHGTDTIANYITVLKSIKYNNTLGGPGVGSVTINVSANDGALNSNTAVATVNIVLNTPPVLDLDGGTGGNNFTTTWAKAGAVNIETATASITDNGTTLASMTATINSPNAGDVLTAVATGNITVDAFAGGTLFMHGTDTLANYIIVLKSIKYNNTVGSPLVSAVTVNVSANDGSLNSNTAVATVNIANSAIAANGRKLFYNNSGTPAPLRYDGNNAAINANDDLAIATNKTAYLPGTGTSTFVNVSSYSKGINGLMIDLTGPHAASLTASDFIFKTGGVGISAATNTPSTYVTFTVAPTISIRTGAGVGGSDRVEIVWPDATSPKKTWLEVIVKANANTGLAQKAGYPAGQGDVFFWGNAVGDSGSGDVSNAITTVTDELEARNNPLALATNVPITNMRDFNRDAIVNINDSLIARNNGTANATAIRFINIASPPAAPEGDGGELAAAPAAAAASSDGGTDSAVASALSASAAPASASSIQLPAWLTSRLASIDLNHGPAAHLFEALAHSHNPAAHRVLVEIDKIADSLGLDDDLLDSLLGQ